jgi:hypothetical protein
MAIVHELPPQSSVFPGPGRINILSDLTTPAEALGLYTELSGANLIPYKPEDGEPSPIDAYLDMLEENGLHISAKVLTRLGELAAPHVPGLNSIKIDTSPPVEGLENAGVPPHRDKVRWPCASFVVVSSGQVTYRHSSSRPRLLITEKLDVEHNAYTGDVLAINNTALVHLLRPRHQSLNGTGNRVSVHYANIPQLHR